MILSWRKMMAMQFPSKRAEIYNEIPDEKWNDWRWQLSHRLNSADDFELSSH